MESPRKINDCYFYYYSTCTKGDNCTFRHEPSALGCETTCQFWKEGKCINVRCNFRHMELRKNRKVIPCYWEQQPGGCLKPHCPFLHQNPKHPSNMNMNMGMDNSQGEARGQDLNKTTGMNPAETCVKNLSHVPDKGFGNPVENPLVVNFEEESDSESVPTHSPVKTPHGLKIKTLEEIKLEKVQAESAAFYSYPEVRNPDDLRDRIAKRFVKKPLSSEDTASIEVLTLTEIRKRKRLQFADGSGDSYSLDDRLGKKQRSNLRELREVDITEVKVKTLDEIRAERAKRSEEEILEAGDDCEVSSTSKNIEVESEGRKPTKTVEIRPMKRLKRSRISERGDEKDEDEEEELKKVKLDEDRKPEEKEEKDEGDEPPEEKEICASELEIEEPIAESNKENVTDVTSIDSNKLDDVLLLDEDDLDDEGTTKPEEDILKDIDDLLNE